MIRASWITSLITGVLYGAALHFKDVAKLNNVLISVLFLIVISVGVIGIPQILESYAEMRKRGIPMLARKEDFIRFYFPAWGRMILWFISGVGSNYVFKFNVFGL